SYRLFSRVTNLAANPQANQPFSLRRIVAQARKELTQIVRDWRTLVLALVLPQILLILIGSSISFTSTDLPIIVQDFEDSPASRDLVHVFRASITFRIVSWPSDRGPEDAFTSGTAHAALIIPTNFGRDIARGVASPVQILVDGSDGNTAKLIAGY